MKKLSRYKIQESTDDLDVDLYSEIVKLLRSTPRGSFEDGLHLFDLDFF